MKNDDSNKYCAREDVSVAMHLQRGAAHHLYRWLPEAEEHSGPRGLWQSSILRRDNYHLLWEFRMCSNGSRK